MKSTLVKIPTGVDATAQHPPTLACYPNPAGHSLTLEYNGQGTSQTARVYNALGQLAQTLPFDSGRLEIYTGHWPSGAYSVQVADSKGQTASARIIKK